MSGTTLDPELFEQIVREVIRRLLDRGVSIANRPTAGQVMTGKPTTELEIDSRLVTLATLANRLNGVARLVVKQRAVVTPAVMDELTDRGIELVRR